MGKNSNRLWRKVRAALIAAGAVSTFVFSGNTAKAASFGHVHTSACYGTVTKTCNDYRQWTEYTSMDYHCPNCLVITPHKTRITWLICNNDLVPDRDVAYYQECSKCGRVRKNDNPEGHSHEHDYTVTDLVCGKTESTTAATISASVDNTGITSGNVTIRANVSVLDSGFSLASAPYNFGYGYTSNPSFEVTKNGTYTVSVMDSNGRVASTSVTVNSIDRDAPVISAI